MNDPSMPPAPGAGKPRLRENAGGGKLFRDSNGSAGPVFFLALVQRRVHDIRRVEWVAPVDWGPRRVWLRAAGAMKFADQRISH